jgi:hypothetical protein
MKFITVNTLEAHLKDDFIPVRINVNHIITISEHWMEKKDSEDLDIYGKILLSNGTEILCEESPEDIEKEFHQLFLKWY